MAFLMLLPTLNFIKSDRTCNLDSSYQRLLTFWISYQDLGKYQKNVNSSWESM